MHSKMRRAVSAGAEKDRLSCRCFERPISIHPSRTCLRPCRTRVADVNCLGRPTATNSRTKIVWAPADTLGLRLRRLKSNGVGLTLRRSIARAVRANGAAKRLFEQMASIKRCHRPHDRRQWSQHHPPVAYLQSFPAHSLIPYKRLPQRCLQEPPRSPCWQHPSPPSLPPPRSGFPMYRHRTILPM